MDAKTAARIESLKHSPAWDDLLAEFERQEEKFWKTHINDMKVGKAINQRELDRALGKLDGIRAILRAPDKAASILKREQEGDEAS